MRQSSKTTAVYGRHRLNQIQIGLQNIPLGKMELIDSVAVGTLWNLLLKDILQSSFQMLEDLAKCSHMRKLCNNKRGRRSLGSYSKEEKKCYPRDFLIQQYKTNVCIVIGTKIWNTNLIDILKCTYLKNGKKSRWRIKILIFLSSI